MPTLWNEENVKYLSAQDIFVALMDSRQSVIDMEPDAIHCDVNLCRLLVNRFRPIIEARYLGQPQDWSVPMNGASPEGIHVMFLKEHWRTQHVARVKELLTWEELLEAEGKVYVRPK